MKSEMAFPGAMDIWSSGLRLFVFSTISTFILSCASLILRSQITVGPGADFATLADAGPGLVAGDTVIVLDGIYSNGTQFLFDLTGTAEAPIFIKSESMYGAIFDGSAESIHLVRCKHVILDGFLIQHQTGNGMNIDDGGMYDVPASHITVRNCHFRDINAVGNNDLLKLSGLDDFHIHHCIFENGAAGSGVDMVGCHHGIIEDCIFNNTGNSGIQAKGGTQHIRIQRNEFRDIAQRAINIGGSTGLEFFRPPLPDPIVSAFEAANIEVFSNLFIGSWSPIAYVGCINSAVRNNTFYQPQNWAIRILQETTVPGFLPCSYNEFSNNIVFLANDLTEVNIGPNTLPATFEFSNNLWYNAANNFWVPVLPVSDENQIIADPLFVDTVAEEFTLQTQSPAIASGFPYGDPETDFELYAFSNPPSIGAFEWQNPEICWGDFDNDGCVSISDLLLFLTGFSCENECIHDLDNDGLTSVSDLLILLSLMGNCC
jgi:hypothetical protein